MKQALAADSKILMHQSNWSNSSCQSEADLFLATNNHIFKNGLFVQVWFAPRFGDDYIKIQFDLRKENQNLWLYHGNGSDPDLALLPVEMKTGAVLMNFLPATTI